MTEPENRSGNMDEAVLGMVISMMKLFINPNSNLAIYEQIVNQMKNLILTGELKSGEALPSIRKLASSLEVSVITTKRAYDELERDGLIRSVAGKGFYVCEANKNYLKEKQYVLIEKAAQELVDNCNSAGMSFEEFNAMMVELWNNAGN